MNQVKKQSVESRNDWCGGNTKPTSLRGVSLSGEGPLSSCCWMPGFSALPSQQDCNTALSFSVVLFGRKIFGSLGYVSLHGDS